MAFGASAPPVAEVEEILSDLGAIHFRNHGRARVYPQAVDEAITLIAGDEVDMFGDWIEIIPLNTVPFAFHVIGVCVCAITAAGNYHIQLGYNTVEEDPGENMEIGERRIRFAERPITRQSELLIMYGPRVPANSRVMGRLKTASGDPDEATLSVVLTRHIDVSHPKEKYDAFPW